MGWLLAGLAGFAGVAVVGSFVEYAVHILMHRRVLMGRVHTEHHKDGQAQGFLGEFAVYLLGTLPVNAGGAVPAWWLGYPAFAAGWAAGGVAYAAFAAYAHQVQHEHPELTFWLPRPVHYLHHRDQMWHHNFGISLDVWDRVFGTYKKAEWVPERPARR